MRRWLLIAVLLLAVVGVWFGGPIVRDIVVRGVRLTRSTWRESDDKTIAEDPQDLADAAAAVVGQPVAVDEYGLARMARSEEGRATEFVKRCLIHVALNDAAAHGWSTLYTLTVSKVAGRTGYFGRQTSRRYSTAVDPYDADLQLARGAAADHAAGTDDAQGAVKFVNTNAFSDADYARVAADWAREGLSPFNIDGCPDHLVFFRRGAA